MRILVLTNLFPPDAQGGYERRCAEVVEHLRRQHSVTVLTGRSRRSSRAPVDQDVRRVFPYGKASRGRTLLMPSHSVTAARAMRQAMHDVNPDVVYLWNMTLVPQSSIAVALQSNVPLAFNMGEYWLERLFNESDAYMRRVVQPLPRSPLAAWGAALRLHYRLHPALRAPLPARRRVGIAWITEHLRENTHVPSYMDPVVDRVIYPFGPRAAALERESRVPPVEHRVLYLGRVSPEKGVGVALAATARLVSQFGIDSRITLAGPVDAASRRLLLADAASLGLSSERVKILGSIEGEQIAREMALASVLVIPSLWDEPGGLVALEAAAARVPVVAANVGGLPELLWPDTHALYFERGDDRGCAAALHATLRDAPATSRRVDAAYRRTQRLSANEYMLQADRFLLDVVAASR